MRIAIDARTVSSKSFGVGFYTYWLIKGLNTIDTTNEYFIFSLNNQIKKEEFGNNFNILYTDIRLDLHPYTEIWENIFLYKELKKINSDLLHNPAFRLPFIFPKKRGLVVTIHDLIPYFYPELMPKKFAIYMRLVIRHAVNKADKIIVISESTKNDLLKLFKISSDRIRVIYESAADFYQPLDKSSCKEFVRKKYNLDKDFILFVSRLEPRKNVVRLIKAFSRTKNRNNCYLVIVGARSWHSEEIFSTVEKLNLKNSIIFLDYVDKNNLVYLYNSATFFILPSLYEGFGLPILEAMACGCPVISSNISSIPEIVDDAGILINPYDIDEISYTIDKVIEDKNLQLEMIRKGFIQVKKFSWIETARRTLDVYYEIK